MAKEFVYLQGKCNYAKFVTPDNKYQRWGLDLYFTEESLAKFKALKLKTHLKMSDDGFFAKISRPVSKLIRGELVAFLPPKIYDKEGMPMEGVLIGNGSDVTVKCEVYRYTPPGSKIKENAIRLESVRVDNLIPYEPKKDFTKEDKEATAGLLEQPEQLF
jgi:hypothetical protein